MNLYSELGYIQQKSCGEDIVEVKPHKMNEILHRCCGLILYEHPKKRAIQNATGFLISNNMVVTCAHAVYDIKDEVYYQKLKFYPAARGELSEYYEIQKFYIPGQFLTVKANKRSQYDYALLKIKGNVKTEIPIFLPFGLGFKDKSERLAIYGYPGSYQKLSTDRVFARQWGLEDENKILSIENTKTTYQISTEPGQSGCPLAIRKDKLNAVVVGIHQGGSYNEKSNIGRVITLDALINLQIWRGECNGSIFHCIDLKNNSQIDFKGTLFLEAKQMQKAIKNQILELRNKRMKNQETNSKSNENHKQGSMNYPFPQEKNTSPYQGKIEKKIALESSFKEQSDIFWDLSTPFLSKFNINGKCVMLEQNSPSLITALRPLEIPSSSTRFRVIQNEFRSDIRLGVITAQRKNQQESGYVNHKNSVGYCLRGTSGSGRVFMNGVAKTGWDQNLYLEKDSILMMEVYTKEKRISFINERNEKEFHFQLDEQFIGVKLYIFVCMFQVGNSVEIL